MDQKAKEDLMDSISDIFERENQERRSIFPTSSAGYVMILCHPMISRTFYVAAVNNEPDVVQR